MYKKIFCLICVFIIFFSCFGADAQSKANLNDWQKELSVNNPVYEKYYENIRLYTYKDHGLMAFKYYYDDDFAKRKDINVRGCINYLTDLKLNANGFLSFSFDNKEYYFIPNHTEPIIVPSDLVIESMSIEKQKSYVENHKMYPDVFNTKASSFLTEKTKNGICDYSSKYIEDYYPEKGIILPWVEGVEGTGKLESLDFDVNNGSSLFILNGYVDPLHPELFKKNGRIKKAKIQIIFEDGTKNVSYIDFLDFVYCKQVNYDRRIMHAKIIIEDVYPGEKYEDTCITRIFTDMSFQK